MRIDDFDDWPDDDKDKKFRRISKHQNKVHVQGFDAGLESGNLKGKGIFKKKRKLPTDMYPEVKSMTFTDLKNRESLYTTGDLEHGSGITSPVIRGHTDDMRVPNLEGEDFDSIRPSRKYKNSFTPLTQKEKDQLISRVDENPYSKNIDIHSTDQVERDPQTGFTGYSIRGNRPTPVLSGDDFDNMQSAGKPRKRSTRRRKTKHKRRRKTKKRLRRNKKRSSRKRNI